MDRPEARSKAEDLVENLVKQAVAGTVKWSTTLNRTIDQGLEAIDKALSEQLAEIKHNERFQKLEGTWRGLHYLCGKTFTGPNLKIRLMNVTKDELTKDLTEAFAYDESHLLKQIYNTEFDMPGGQPYGVLLAITNSPSTLRMWNLLKKVSGVAAGAFCQFISSASPDLFSKECHRGPLAPEEPSDQGVPRVHILGSVNHH